MRFVDVHELQNLSPTGWKTLTEAEDPIVTSNGEPVALLSALPDPSGLPNDSLNHYVNTVKRARAQASVAAMQEASTKTGIDGMSLDRINAKINSARSERSRNSSAGKGAEPAPKTIRASFTHTDAIPRLIDTDATKTPPRRRERPRNG